jgi:hypothetical protein
MPFFCFQYCYSLIWYNQRIKNDSLGADHSPKFKELCDNIAQLISEIGSVVSKKNQEADVASAEAREQVTRAQAEVTRSVIIPALSLRD